MSQTARKTLPDFAERNRLYYGDNLTIMREMPSAVVDLIYLDPPFNSNRDYNAIYADETGHELPVQIRAFTDTWKLDGGQRHGMEGLDLHTMHRFGINQNAAAFFHATLENLREHDESMYSYLTYMSVRLLEMKRLLKSTGSIYLHCDPTASHYLKIVMDCIFGAENFRNEIIWHHPKIGVATKRFTSNIDQIFFYSMSDSYSFRPLRQDKPNELYTRWANKLRDDCLYYREAKTINDSPAQSKIKQAEKVLGRPLMDDDVVVDFTDESNKKIIDNVWRITYLKGNSQEYMGYQTQKPLALLNRIVEASSKPGDLVFDPFCGCATTIIAAHEHDRKWMGIDVSIFAIKRVAQKRLSGISEYDLLGYPVDYDSAIEKANQNRFEFQEWAIGDIYGIPNSIVVGDGGDDGRIYFGTNPRRMARVEVKSGANVPISAVRDLRGVLDREKSNTTAAVLILLHDLGAQKRANFEKEMRAAGTFEIDGVEYPRMQLVMVRDYFQYNSRERYRVVNLPNIVKPHEGQQSITGIHDRPSTAKR